MQPLVIGILCSLAVLLQLSALPPCQVSAKSRNAYFFQDKHRTTQAFVAPSHFWSHTSMVTSLVYSSASARRTAVRGTALQFSLDALILSPILTVLALEYNNNNVNLTPRRHGTGTSHYWTDPQRQSKVSSRRPGSTPAPAHEAQRPNYPNSVPHTLPMSPRPHFLPITLSIAHKASSSDHLSLHSSQNSHRRPPPQPSAHPWHTLGVPQCQTSLAPNTPPTSTRALTRGWASSVGGVCGPLFAAAVRCSGGRSLSRGIAGSRAQFNNGYR